MSLLMSTENKPLVLAHFDGHGVATGALLARKLGAEIYTKFPDLHPRNFASFLRAHTGMLMGRDIYIVDIPIDVQAPQEFIAALREVATNFAKSVTVYDHHETDLVFLQQVQANIKWLMFSTATDMLLAIARPEEKDFDLGVVGVVADRDQKIVKIASREEVERKYMPLANTLDVLVRQDALATAKALVAEGVDYLARQTVEYPPYKLASQVQILHKTHVAVLVDARNIPPQWVPKTLEQIAIRERVDYVVAINEVQDRRTGEKFPVVQVLKYWLSDRPSPEFLLRNVPEIQGRQVVGHADYISIRCMNIEDAQKIAEKSINQLTAPSSTVAHLISERHVAEAVQADFKAILQRLTEILEEQKKMYQKYLELKETQVKLLEGLRRPEAD